MSEQGELGALNKQNKYLQSQIDNTDFQIQMNSNAINELRVMSARLQVELDQAKKQHSKLQKDEDSVRSNLASWKMKVSVNQSE